MDSKDGKQNKNQMDMLHGNLLSKLILFALPLALSSILQQLFNSVDVAVVGKFASSQAQAAVGCNASLINMFINLFVGISIGANVIIANYIGQNRLENIKKTVHTAMTFSIISGFFLLALGLFAARPILTWMGTPADVLNHAVLYLRIYFLGMPFIMIYNFGSAILRSVGDTKRPLYCLIFSGAVNTLLNLVLVIVFHLGVAGVAIATLIAHLISAGMIWYYLTHEEGIIHLSVRDLGISLEPLKRMLVIGVPAGLQNMVLAFSNVYLQTVLNSYGSDAVAGVTVSLNFEYFVYFIIVAFNQAAVTFISQNYGAQQYQRCRKIFRISLITCMVTIAGISFCFLAGSDFFISLFTSQTAVAEYAKIRMLHVLALNFLAPTYEVGGAALRGLGYSTTPAVLTILGTCVLRILWAYFVCPRFPGFEVLLNVYPVSWVVTGSAVLLAYLALRRKAFA